MKNLHPTSADAPSAFALASLAHDITGTAVTLMLILEMAGHHTTLERKKSAATLASATMSRLRNLLAELRAFSGAGLPPATGNCDTAETLAQTLDIFGLQLPAQIALIRLIWPRLHAVALSPLMVYRILLNLLRNAQDAMLPGGGQITVLAQNHTLRPAMIASHGWSLKPGPYVLVSVKDTGPGIAPEVRNRLFEPYATTKAPGQGTGLGLATVRRLLEENGGAITCKNGTRQGTQFNLYFPAICPGLVMRPCPLHQHPRPPVGPAPLAGQMSAFAPLCAGS